MLLVFVVAGCSGPSNASEIQRQASAPTSTLALSEKALEKNPVATARVSRARLAADLLIVGSVSVDQDHYALLGPLVPGRVARVRAGLGRVVKAGEVLAEIESAEVGQAQAAYLTAEAHAGAAQANLRRERDLAAQHISSEREREVAEAQARSDEADVRAARQRLIAFGLAEADIAALRTGAAGAGRVPLRSPISGTVIARNVTIGQAVERGTDAFKVADLGRLWVLLDLFEKDLGRVHIGQKVELRSAALGNETLTARIAYVDAIIDEKTRTANVRIALDNCGGRLRLGEFVTARIVGDMGALSPETLTISRRAVVTVEGKAILFVKTTQGFERRAVELGQSGGDLVEVKAGVSAGDEVATDGAFLLKSELLR